MRIPWTVQVGEVLKAFLRRNAEFIRRQAHRQSLGRYEMIDDLQQEARIKSWELEPTRFDMDREADKKYVRKSFKRRMQRVRAELLAQAGGWRDVGKDLLTVQREAEESAVAEGRHHIEKPWEWDEETEKACRAVRDRRWRVNADGSLEILT